MAKSSTKESATNKKWLLAGISFVLFASFIGVGVIGYRRIAPARAARRAGMLLEKGDYRSASLSAQRALHLDRNNLAACRIMAELLDRTNQTQQAVAWRRRVCESPAHTLTDTLDWAASALRAEQPREAQRALERIPAADRDDVRVHACAGALAVAVEQFEVARGHYARALQLRPADERLQFNFAVTTLRAGNPEQRDAATAQLEQLSRRPAWRVLALRSLVSEALAHKNWPVAIGRARELINESQANFSDRLLYLEALQRAADPEAAAFLAFLKTEAGSRPVEAGLLVGWMTQMHMALQGAAWAATLPRGITATPQAGAAIAACLVETKDWPALQALVAPTRWGPLEPLRLAFLARALREQGKAEESEVQWKAALAEGRRPEHSLAPLARLALAWGWESEVNTLLPLLAESPRDALLGLQLLYRQSAARGDTPALRRIAERILTLDPNNDAARNNVAMLSLLMQTDVTSATDTAEKLHTQAKDNPVYASTYAYALYLQHRPAEALQVMNALPLDQQEDPANAVYYALYLAANGDRDKARRYIERAKSANLLPEEKALLTQASRRVN